MDVPSTVGSEFGVAIRSVGLGRVGKDYCSGLNTTTGDDGMSELRMIAIASELADKVRETMVSPGYGHPVTAKVATGHGPCRHCLRPFVVGEEVRLLFTLDPFYRIAAIPQPGPVFIHADACERYVETAGYPAELVPFGVVLDGYDGEQMIRRRETATGGSQEATIQKMMCDPFIRYVMVRDATAGCFDLRVERDNSRFPTG
jgi:hypothetical protein